MVPCIPGQPTGDTHGLRFVRFLRIFLSPADISNDFIKAHCELDKEDLLGLFFRKGTVWSLSCWVQVCRKVPDVYTEASGNVEARGTEIFMTYCRNTFSTS